jgi:hypothetical protein
MLPSSSAAPSCRTPPQSSYRYQDVLGANPTHNCSIGFTTDTYDYYSGSSSYLQVQNTSNYVKLAATNKWAWYVHV